MRIKIKLTHFIWNGGIARWLVEICTQNGFVFMFIVKVLEEEIINWSSKKHLS
jgi:hypothetical protein